MVHTSGNETIAGNKTFTSTPNVTSTFPELDLKNTNLDVTTFPSSTQYGLIFVRDKNNAEVGSFGIRKGTTATEFYSYIKMGNGTPNTTFGLRLESSQSYMYGPSRAYASAGNSDILVKGHVADMMTANVSNHPVKIYSAQNNLISTTTLNQFVDQDITLPASSVQYQNVTFGGSSPTTGTTAFTLQSTPDYANYPYRASYALTGVTADTYVSVTFSDAQVDSGNFASFAKTVNGYVYLYANADVGATTVPTISLGMDDTAAAGLATSALDGKVNKLETTGRKVYTHNGTTQGELTYSENYVGNSIAYRDANGRMAVADPVSGSTSQTVATTNWVSQTGNSAPNNLVHRTGNETITGTKTFEKNIVAQGSSNTLAYIVKRTDIDSTNPVDGKYIDLAFARDTNNTNLGWIQIQTFADGHVRMRLVLRNSDGSLKYITLGESDVI